LRNVRFGNGRPLESRTVQHAVAAGEARLGAGGRLVIRNSGTEPVIRVMAQGEDEALLSSVVDEICEAILAVARAYRGDRVAGRVGSPGGGMMPRWR
jgi:phosphoglucosamine mutase